MRGPTAALVRPNGSGLKPVAVALANADKLQVRPAEAAVASLDKLRTLLGLALLSAATLIQSWMSGGEVSSLNRRIIEPARCTADTIEKTL